MISIYIHNEDQWSEGMKQIGKIKETEFIEVSKEIEEENR
jgi:hypothetical protein